MVASIVGIVLTVPLTYLFMYTFDYGLSGIPFAQAVQSIIVQVIIVLYCWHKPEIREVLQPIDCEAFQGWGSYLMVSLPATVMICAEAWAFQGLTFLAGILGVLELASQTICINMITILFMVPVGIQEATSGLIGNCIGANNVKLAKRFFILILKITVPILIIMALLTIILRHQIVLIFTNDRRLIEMSTPLMIITGCNFLADGFQGFLAGPIRALGLQKLASYMALASYWLVGIPLSAIFAFVLDLGVNGLLEGFIVATAL